jgi:hypothetical protein
MEIEYFSILELLEEAATTHHIAAFVESKRSAPHPVQ